VQTGAPSLWWAGVLSACHVWMVPTSPHLYVGPCHSQGGYRACSRIGIESSISPFLKMSYETAAHFLTDATLRWVGP
jgi:DNA-directed RNA polymerase I subunit RPA1